MEEVFDDSEDILIRARRTEDSLPTKSRAVYDKEFKIFVNWKLKNAVTVVNESVMMAYFQELSEKYTPNSLYTKYSLLKSTLIAHDNVDISRYNRLLSFLKKRSKGYTPKKSKVLTEEQVLTFIKNAPNEVYLLHKDQTAKREYNKWSKEDMDAATQNYNNGTQKFNEVCRVYGIPKPTFRRHLRGLNSRGKIGRPRDLTAEMEVELVCHVLDLESRLFDLTTKDLKRLASQLSEKYKLPHRFNKEKQLAGWTWYYKFIKNHPEITLRTAESTSIARCKGLKKVVTEFFDKYEKILDDLKFKPNQIFNVDGRIHKVISEERGINTTCICCMNATGEFIPPMVIFKCKSMTDDIKRGGPPNTLYTCSETGWIIAALFVEWLHHFIKHLKLKKVLDQRQQILLILDGHTTHTKNLDAINLAKEYGIIMLSLPAQLQPLDISVFKPLKHYFNEECTAWIRNNPGAVIKQTNISEILGIAYSRAVCVETAINGFELCGLWPCNRHKLRDEEKDETTTQNSVRLTEPGPSTSNVPINEYNPSVSPIRAKRRVDFQQNILKKKTRKLVLQAM